MIHFRVIGEPAPQGSKRHVGRGILIESSKKVAPWRSTVAAAAVEHGGRVSGAVHVRMTFFLRRPPSAPKSRLWPDRKPDLDKLERSTLDALVTAGTIEDDARVVTLYAEKRYATEGWTGALITVTPDKEVNRVDS